MILQETIDKCFQLDIVDVISRFVELKRSGSNYKGLSPFTQERTPSFMVSPAKQIFKDFSSGKGGGVVKFIEEHQQLSFPEAIKFLCDNFGIDFLESEKSDEEKEIEKNKESLYLLNIIAKDFYKEKLESTDAAKRYLIEHREIPQDIIDYFELGFSGSSVSELATKIINEGYSWEIAVQASLLSYKDNSLFDRFRNRIMFPIKNTSGRIIGFGGRYIGSRKEMAKYLNSSDSLIYNKSNTLYGIFESKKAIAELNKAYLTEGYLDTISFYKKGIKNVVSSSGTSITSEQALLIKRFTKNICIIFDSDSSGIKSSLRGIDILLKEGLNVSVCLLPKGEDPDSFVKGKSKEEIQEYIDSKTKDFLGFKYNYLIEQIKEKEDLSKRAEIVSELCRTISFIPDRIKKEIYIKELSRISDTNIESLRQFLNTKEIEDIVIEDNWVQDTDIYKYKNFIKEQCEKRIIQLILSYGETIFPFQEIVITESLEEKTIIHQMTVKEKIKKEISDDGIQLSNPFYASLFEGLYKVDLSDLKNILKILPEQTYLICDRLKSEEIYSNTNDFVNQKEDYVKEFQDSITNAIPRTVMETIMYYKTLFIEDLIQEEVDKEIPDQETISDYAGLLNKIRNFLNLI